MRNLLNGVRAIAGALALWSSLATAATLTWNPNGEPDLSGYRIYQCTLLPCAKWSGTLLATLGRTTSLDIGTPPVITYYFVTAYNFANVESEKSNVVTFSPFAPFSSSPSTLPIRIITLTVVGNPAAGSWGVEGYATDLRDIMATVTLDGVFHHVDHNAPYGFPDDNGLTATQGQFGMGPHTVYFFIYLDGSTTTLFPCTTVFRSAPCPSAPSPPAMRIMDLTVVGNPAAGSWGVEGSTTDLRNVMATVTLD